MWTFSSYNDGTSNERHSRTTKGKERMKMLTGTDWCKGSITNYCFTWGVHGSNEFIR